MRGLETKQPKQIFQRGLLVNPGRSGARGHSENCTEGSGTREAEATHHSSSSIAGTMAGAAFVTGTRCCTILQLFCFVGVVGGRGMGAYQAGVQLQESLASGESLASPSCTRFDDRGNRPGGSSQGLVLRFSSSSAAISLVQNEGSICKRRSAPSPSRMWLREETLRWRSFRKNEVIDHLDPPPPSRIVSCSEDRLCGWQEGVLHGGG